jgi:hypothetical protein
MRFNTEGSNDGTLEGHQDAEICEQRASEGLLDHGCMHSSARGAWRHLVVVRRLRHSVVVSMRRDTFAFMTARCTQYQGKSEDVTMKTKRRNTRNLRIGISILVLVAILIVLWEFRVYHLFSAH